MDDYGYQILKRAALDGIVDRPRLEKLRRLLATSSTGSPAIARKIDLLLDEVPFDDPHHGLDAERFTRRFREGGDGLSARDRLDEVVVTFLLFLASQSTQQKLSQTFVHHGEWESEYGWSSLLKRSAFCIFTLAYGVSWRDGSERFFLLDDMTFDLTKGESEALRTFAGSVGVRFHSPRYPAETHFGRMDYHSSRVFGPYCWRMIHWMAQAFSRRHGRDAELAKTMWRDFATSCLYRTLRCGYCMFHYRSLMEKKKEEKKKEKRTETEATDNGEEKENIPYRDRILQASDGDFPHVWYDLHNEVNASSGKPAYSESEFQADREFMDSALELLPGP